MMQVKQATSKRKGGSLDTEPQTVCETRKNTLALPQAIGFHFSGCGVLSAFRFMPVRNADRNFSAVRDSTVHSSDK